SDYNNHFFYFNFRLQPDSKSILKLRSNYNYWNRSLPGLELGYSPGTSKQIDRDIVSSFIYERAISKAIQIKSNLDYKYSLRSYYDTATFNLSAPINSFYKSISYISGTAFNFIPSKKKELNFGYELSYNNIVSNEIAEVNLING